MTTVRYFLLACFLGAIVVHGNEDKLRDRMQEHTSKIVRRAVNKISSSGVLSAAKSLVDSLGLAKQSGSLISGKSNSQWVNSCIYGNPKPILNTPIPWYPTRWTIGPYPAQPISGIDPRISLKKIEPNYKMQTLPPRHTVPNDLIFTTKSTSGNQVKAINRDYIFVLDTSGSISAASFKMMIEGTALLAEYLCPLNVDRTSATGSKQLAVVMFSDIVNTVIDFKDTRAGIDNVRTQIMDLKHRRGSATATANALRHVRENVLHKEGSRLGNPTTSTDIIVVTDGRCNKNCQSLAEEADKLREAGANVVALGVGNARECELQIISGKGAGFWASDFKQFEHFTKVIRDIALSSDTHCAA